MIAVSACMGGTRGSGVLSSAGDMLEMSVVRGVCGVCDMCMCLFLLFFSSIILSTSLVPASMVGLPNRLFECCFLYAL